jgi:hypothetical protein
VWTVFPVPPLEKCGIMLSVAGEIDGASEYVENAPINGTTANRAKLPIHSVRICTAKVLDAADTNVIKISRQTRTDTRNLL